MHTPAKRGTIMVVWGRDPLTPFYLLIILGSYPVFGSGPDCKSGDFGLGWFDSITTHYSAKKYHRVAESGYNNIQFNVFKINVHMTHIELWLQV